MLETHVDSKLYISMRKERGVKVICGQSDVVGVRILCDTFTLYLARFRREIAIKHWVKSRKHFSSGSWLGRMGYFSAWTNQASP
jgi:hypothetical protein